MEFLLEFSLEPTMDMFFRTKNLTQFAQEYPSLYDPWMQLIFIKYNQELLDEKTLNGYIANGQQFEIDALYGLEASPVLRKLNIAWSLFFATTDIIYLRAAYNTIYNVRATEELKNTAKRLFDFVDGYYESKGLNSDMPAIVTFREFKKILADKNNSMNDVTHLISSVETYKYIEPEVECDYQNENSDEKNKNRKKQNEKLFDTIAHGVFNKIR